MQMEPVESSNIRAIGYDAATKHLRVQFSSGAIYEYADVSATKHADLLAADSAGKHFAKHIRGHKFRQV
jgi:KTSC domain